LARTAPVAITARELFTYDPPFDLRRFAHIPLLQRSYTQVGLQGIPTGII
jgi:hypothetical protein